MYTNHQYMYCDTNPHFYSMTYNSSMTLLKAHYQIYIMILKTEEG